MGSKDNGGWIRHRGGKCPVEAGTLVDTKHRDGKIIMNHRATADKTTSEIALQTIWEHRKDEFDIMYWRPHVATEEPCEHSEHVRPGDGICVECGEKVGIPVIDPVVAENVKKFNEVTITYPHTFEPKMPASKYFDGPLQWRDRIHELDAEQKAADEAHKAETEARDAERAELVAKLRAEGLALIQAENMSDPANWQVDDIVEIIGSTNDGWLRYKGMKGQLKYDGDWFVNFGLANEWYLSDNTDIKWHSRPAK